MMAKKRRCIERLSDGDKLNEDDSLFKADDLSIDEVTEARDRLKGALKELMHSGDETESSHDETPTQLESTGKMPSKRIIRRRRRRRKVSDMDQSFHNTYVMKLYDRSVDLAQFNEDTPLYPICRAWMANQPRQRYFALPEKPRSPSPPKVKVEVVDVEMNGETSTSHSPMVAAAPADSKLKDRFELPPPTYFVTDPSLKIPKQEPAALRSMDCLQVKEEEILLPPHDSLLRGHITRWGKIRRQWMNAAAMNESRYQQAGDILHAMYI